MFFKVLIDYDPGGQDCIIGCVAREEFKQLDGQRIEFVALTCWAIEGIDYYG